MSDGTAARAQRVGLGVVLGLGCLDLWRFIHYQANPDGVSYLDIARAFAAEGPHALINGYWSPLLPALIGAAYRASPPTIDTMYPIAHAVLFLPFVLAVFAFHHFLSVARRRARVVSDAPVATQVAGIVVAWSAFTLFILKGIGVWLITPDIGVAAIVFWLAAESFSLADGPWPAGRWIRVGVVLAIGYWWKAILFPVGLVWLAAAALVSLRRRDPWRAVATGALAYGALALVLIVPVSRYTGRATFGETGRLNYLWYVNAAPYVWERCLPSSVGESAAAPFGSIDRATIISERPVTCLIDSPATNATLPLWDDPSRFYRNAHSRVDVPRQLRAIATNVSYLRAEIVLLGPALFVGAALVVLGSLIPLGAALFRKRDARELTGPFLLGTLIAAPIAFYLLVYVEFRHVAPFFTVAAALAPALVLTAFARRGRLVVGALATVALVDVSWRTSEQTLIGFALARATVVGRAPERIPVTQIVARALRDAGLAPGTRVASVNDEWNAEWAQLAELRVRAHVPEQTTAIPHVLRALRDSCARAAWDAALRAHAIDAVVARIPEGLPIPPEFERLNGTAFHLHRVPGTAGALSAACALPSPTRSSS